MVSPRANADELSARAGAVSTASLHEAGGKIGALPHWLRPLDPERRLCGRVFPVFCPEGDNLALHHAIYAAAPGEVLVVDCGDGEGYGYWGEIMTAAAMARGLGGLVISGGVRDSVAIRRMGFPVFSRSVAIHGTGKDPRGGARLGASVRLGDVEVTRGDVIVGDADGLIALPAARAAEIVDRALARDEEETVILRRLAQGETTLAIYGLPQLDVPRPPRPRRRSVHVEGLAHGALPIPNASVIGGLIATGGVGGKVPASGLLSDSLEQQVQGMFANLARVIAAAGAGPEDVLKVTIWMADPERRSVLNPPWIDMFPDPQSRPARHVLKQDLPGGLLVQCEALACMPLESR